MYFLGGNLIKEKLTDISYFYFFYIFLQTTMLQSIERYMKQAIVDRCHAVASAALVSSLVSLLYFVYCVESLKDKLYQF